MEGKNKRKKMKEAKTRAKDNNSDKLLKPQFCIHSLLRKPVCLIWMKGFPSAGPKTRRCWWGERSDEVLQKCAIRRKNPRGLFSPSLTSKDGWKRLTTDRVGQAVVEPGLGAVCLYHMIWFCYGYPRYLVFQDGHCLLEEVLSLRIVSGTFRDIALIFVIFL